MNNDQPNTDHMAQQMHDTPPAQPPFRCKIAGIPHRKPDLSVLHLDDLVALVPEPTNLYDPNAIKVMSDANVHLGYIPKTDTSFARGVEKMKIVRVEPSDKWNEVHIETI